MSSYGRLPVRECTAGQTGPVDGHGGLDGAAYPTRDSGYTAYEQQSYACPPSQNLPVGYENTPDQLAYTSNVYGHLDTGYDLPPTMISETKARKDPVVTGYNPEEGGERTRVIVHIRSDHDLVLSAITRASLSFATQECPAQLTSLGFRSAYSYAVTSEAPTFAATGSCSPHVLICLRLQNDSGMTVHSMDVGYFRYTTQYEPGIASTQAMFREQSNQSSATYSPIEKRAVVQQLSQGYPSGSYRIATSPFPHRIRPHAHDSSPRYSPYELPQTSSKRRSSTFSSETANSSMPSAPQDPGWASSYTAINGSGKIPNSMTLSPSFSLIPPTTITSSPGLIRTTELVKALKAKALKAKALKARIGSGHIASPGDGLLDPYSETFKHFAANLVIKGYLESMTEDWTPEEYKVKRRLVKFWRSQTGGTLNTGFAPVETCVRKSGTISCILWDKGNGCCQYVVTSVDIIHLLDFLVDCKTDTKEQNRIRRNVDKFDKRTIYKTCEETGTLFDLVMGFPEPKPRHIAKAVKVFPWNFLATAITKVIEKYSPDYWGAAAFIRDNPKLMQSVNGSTSKPKSLLKGVKKDVNKDDIDSNASCSPTPQSAANSTPSPSHSSAYSPSGPSCASSITSPNIQGSQLSETMARHHIGPTSDPLQYASTLYPYSRPDALGTHPMTHISMAAGLPVRGSWDFSGMGQTNHPFYKGKEE